MPNDALNTIKIIVRSILGSPRQGRVKNIQPYFHCPILKASTATIM